MTGTQLGLADYCAACADRSGRARTDTLTDPESIQWEGGRAVVASYRCVCGHCWITAWDALHALGGVA
ncbi:hypothetical protein [Mycolicibacterium hippocampi]|uniref:Uncharacterized protein n=1 Tax=Mycolicibacterium hippocampi TaxID=659824 RepID=A0A850PMV6_9MYCO|nr:hypothetical protein [Mycolicibacterium hippocampi]NVN51692.1 hypothetical protein [Mycolicibacterium hippocampi]